MDEAGIAAVEKRVRERNARAARACRAGCRPPARRMSSSTCTRTPLSRRSRRISKSQSPRSAPPIKRVNGEITYRDAIKEAVIEEMQRDSRVIFYGEDVAEYGGAFKLCKGLLEMFGRERVFNTPISEARFAGRRWARP